VTVVARRIASVPVRTAVETWERIVELLTKPDSDAREELTEISSIASMLIADEHMKDTPITIAGGGPLVRIYTVHAADAIEHEVADETDLPFNPTSDDRWTLSLPATGADVAIVEAAVAEAPHVKVRDVGATSDQPVAVTSTSAAGTDLELELQELERP
jgi:hypothetical protein